VLEKAFFLRSKHFLWMVPASDLVIYTGLGLVIAAGVRSIRRVSARMAVGVLIFLAFLSELLLVRGLSLLTCLLIAGGFGLRTAGWFESRLRRFPWLYIGGTVVLSTIVGGLAMASLAWERSARSGTSTVGQTTSAQAPNVLLIVLDTVRADHLSLYGYSRDTTPNLKRLAERGVRFDHARSTAPWTLPSHASIFTGHWPHELAVEQIGWLDRTAPTLAEFLGVRGFATAGFIANQFFCGHESGLSRGFAVYRDYPVTAWEVFRASTLGWLITRSALRVRDELHWLLGSSSVAEVSVDFSRKDAAMVNREFLDWLSGHGDQPFFAFLNYFDAHDPYLPPAGVAVNRQASPKSRAEIAVLRDWYKIKKEELPPQSIALARDAYDDCIAALDNELGKLFAELDRRGVLDQTLIVLTADHGEQFGENGRFGHGQSLHAPEVHVPLVIVAPSGVPRGSVVTAGVSLRDIPRTVVDLLGCAQESPFPGLSLARTWRTPPPPGNCLVSAPLSELHAPLPEDDGPPAPGQPQGAITALLYRQNVYIRHQGGDEELYEVGTDPSESQDLSRDTAAKAVLEQCRSILDRLIVGSVSLGATSTTNLPAIKQKASPDVRSLSSGNE
jgi:arylsulfatase A-like enzyme